MVENEPKVADVEKLAAQTKLITDGAEDLELETPEDYKSVLELMGNLYALKESAEKLLRPTIEALFKEHRKWTGQYNSIVKPVNSTIDIFKRKIAAYINRTKQEVEAQATEDIKKMEAAGIKTEGLISVDTGANFAKDIAKDGGMVLVDEYDFTIPHPELLPREYLIPDLKKIKAVVTALKTEAHIPGVIVTKTSTLRKSGGARP